MIDQARFTCDAGQTGRSRIAANRAICSTATPKISVAWQPRVPPAVSISQYITYTKLEGTGTCPSTVRFIYHSLRALMHLYSDIDKISGPLYCSGQTLVEHVSYALSDKIYSYGAAEEELDTSITAWVEGEQKNAAGIVATFARMQTRSGAASMILGNIFSRDFNLVKKNVPASILATSSSLIAMKPVLDQLSLLYSSATPLVAHVSSLDLSPVTSSFVSDYTRALAISREGGYIVVSSSSVHEVQHMALFATILSSVLPTVHTYDGVRMAREDTRVVDVLNQAALKKAYDNVLQNQESISKKADDTDKVLKLLKNLNSEMGTEYGLFEYFGAKDATTVVVVFGSPEAAIAKLVATQLSSAGQKVGVVNVRVYRPFAEDQFLSVLPKTTSKVVVLGQIYAADEVSDASVTSILYSDVLGALAMSDEWAVKRPAVVDVKYTRETQWRASNMAAVFEQAVKSNHVDVSALQDSSTANIGLDAEQFVQWDLDVASSADSAGKLSCVLAMEGKQNVSFSTAYDNYAEGGVFQAEVKTSSRSIEASYPIEAADLSIVTDAQILRSYDVTRNVRIGGTLVLKHGFKPEEIEKKLPDVFKKAVAEKSIKLLLLNPAGYGDSVSGEYTDSALMQLVALRLVKADLSVDEIVSKSADMHSEVSKDVLKALVDNLEKALITYEVPSDWSSLETSVTLPGFISANSFVANTEKETIPLDTEKTAWQTAAKHIAFKEAYQFQSALRPDVGVKTWQVKVQANRRLTPTHYDRNIFHIEFDTTGTDLKYELGESLGVHAHNDGEQVEAFLTGYGLVADELIQVPSRGDPTVMETRTVFQALQQNVDLFGRPGKKFYEDLGVWAEDEAQKKLLTSLGTPEGVVDFKRRSEVETITYADLLEEFTSARPPVEELVKLIPPTKRREYSVSSSQKVHPNSVHLLVVVVDWRDQRDRERFGQCTRYLSHLEIGDCVTVSLKPSVMKLPARSEQPIIMAGLGTGLAPFRAFVEERAWQKAQGMEIGAVMLYLGSRHQKEEYLYGEEWEAYRDAGIITTLGQAFSRDQPKKVYIQDVMRSTLAEIETALLGQEGSFYLCGPTWPVPDVQEVLEEAIRSHHATKGSKVESNKVIEELKDTHRYVLEVY